MSRISIVISSELQGILGDPLGLPTNPWRISVDSPGSLRIPGYPLASQGVLVGCLGIPGESQGKDPTRLRARSFS